jgi:hypothetical protein
VFVFNTNMAKEPSEMSEFSTEGKESRMSAAAEASMHMRTAAGVPLKPVGPAIYRAWVTVRGVMIREKMERPIILSRAEDIWREEPRRIDSDEMDALRLAAAEAQRKREDEETARYIARLHRQRAAMLATDPEMFGEEAATLERTIRALGRYRQSVASSLTVDPTDPGSG